MGCSKSPMLHTKFRENRPAGSGEEDFWRVFTIYGRGGHLGHVTQMPRTKYRSPYLRRLHIKFGFDRPSGSGEDVWALWTTTDGRRTMSILQAHLWAFSSGELITGLPISRCKYNCQIISGFGENRRTVSGRLGLLASIYMMFGIGQWNLI